MERGPKQRRLNEAQEGMQKHSCRIVKREPKQRSLNEAQEGMQKRNEEPSEFLKRIFKAYGRIQIQPLRPREFKDG